MTNQLTQTLSIPHQIVKSYFQEMDSEEIDEILYTHTLYPFGSIESIEKDILTYVNQLKG